MKTYSLRRIAQSLCGVSLAMAAACGGTPQATDNACVAPCVPDVIPPVAGSGGGIAAPLGSGGMVATVLATGGNGAGGGQAMAGTGASGSGGAAGGNPMGTGGTAGVGGMMAGTGGTGVDLGPGQTLPPVADYGAPGPFATTTKTGTGPNGMYTMIRPTTLGENGFKHPIATWGNGITTTPATYPGLLGGIASHGFVIIASNSTNVTAAMMTTGLDWLIAQNDAAGDLQGKLDVMRAVSIGYSLGGGAAVTTGGHKNVITTVSMHGLPGQAGNLHGPLLLFTSTMDTFVSADGFVTPNFTASKVPTFYAWLAGAGDGGHLTPIGDAGVERAPMIAWLRLWVYDDQAARKYFDGPDCILCKAPWSVPKDTKMSPQTKNWP